MIAVFFIEILCVFIVGRIKIIVVAVIVPIGFVIVIVIFRIVIAFIEAVIIAGLHVYLPLDLIFVKAALAELVELLRDRIAEAVHAVHQHIPEINDLILKAARRILVIERVKVILVARTVIRAVIGFVIRFVIFRIIPRIILVVLVKINAVVVDLDLELFLFLRCGSGCFVRFFVLCSSFVLCRIIRSSFVLRCIIRSSFVLCRILCFVRRRSFFRQRLGFLCRFRFISFLRYGLRRRLLRQRPNRLRIPDRSRLISDLCELLIE